METPFPQLWGVGGEGPRSEPERVGVCGRGLCAPRPGRWAENGGHWDVSALRPAHPAWVVSGRGRALREAALGDRSGFPGLTSFRGKSGQAARAPSDPSGGRDAAVESARNPRRGRGLGARGASAAPSRPVADS